MGFPFYLMQKGDLTDTTLSRIVTLLRENRPILMGPFWSRVLETVTEVKRSVKVAFAILEDGPCCLSDILLPSVVPLGAALFLNDINVAGTDDLAFHDEFIQVIVMLQIFWDQRQDGDGYNNEAAVVTFAMEQCCRPARTYRDIVRFYAKRLHCECLVEEDKRVTVTSKEFCCYRKACSRLKPLEHMMVCGGCRAKYCRGS